MPCAHSILQSSMREVTGECIVNGSRCAFIEKVFLFLPGTVSQAELRDYGRFHRVFPITELETRVRGIDSGLLSDRLPCYLPLRKTILLGLSGTIPRKFHGNGESPVSRAIMRQL